MSNRTTPKRDTVTTTTSEKVREAAWAIINKLIDPTRGIIFCDRWRVEEVVAEGLSNLLGTRQPAKGTIAKIAADCARQMLGPNPNRCITNPPRAHAVLQDGINFALGKRESPYELSEAQLNALNKGRSKGIRALRQRKSGATAQSSTQTDHKPIPHLPHDPATKNEP